MIFSNKEKVKMLREEIEELEKELATVRKMIKATGPLEDEKKRMEQELEGYTCILILSSIDYSFHVKSFNLALEINQAWRRFHIKILHERKQTTDSSPPLHTF
jgi:hypothetical protein